MFKFIFSFIFIFSLFTSPIFAQTEKWTLLQVGLGTTCVDDPSKPAGEQIATLQGFECLFANILQIIILLAGFAAFIVLIIGGFQYLTSAGDPKQLQKATGTITGAVIGIIVTLAVWFIFKLLNTVTGLDLLKFEIPK